MAVPKLERLLDLIAELLHAERPITADELHRRIPGYPPDKDSFKRAFERDKKDLREMDIPLRIESVPGRMPPEDGYRIDQDEYGLPDPGLDPDELAALHLAANAVRLDGTNAHDRAPQARRRGRVRRDAVQRRRARLGAEPRRWRSRPSASTAGCGSGTATRTASSTRSGSTTSGATGTSRATTPTPARAARSGSTASTGRWTAGDPDSVEVAVDPSDHPLRLDGWALGDDEPVQARVRVDPPQAALGVRLVGDDVAVEWDDDGGVVLEFPVRRRDGFRSFVFGFLDDAEVLGPPELRDDVVTLARGDGRRSRR